MSHRNPDVPWNDEATSPIKFLESLKKSLEHTRRFTVDMRPGLNPYVNKVCTTEAAIEEWLIENGFWISDEDF